jgi:hypothetical protein
MQEGLSQRGLVSAMWSELKHDIALTKPLLECEVHLVDARGPVTERFS